MQLCAIICEYNPLHLGHAWQIEQAKRRFGSVVCIMSGSFVQRGEPPYWINLRAPSDH